MPHIYICAAKRSPIGTFGGVLSALSAQDIAAQCLKATLQTSTQISALDPSLVSELIMGHVLQAGCGQAPARQVALKAGLTPHTTTYSVNRVCASGLKAIMLASNTLRAGEAELIVAGGMESMSQAPHLLQGRKGLSLGQHRLLDHMMHDGLTDAYDKQPMGHFAELCAAKYSISRKEQDDYAELSYKRAREASEKRWFDEEIAPITTKHRKGETITHCDEEPFRDITKLRSLRPLFAGDQKMGSITAGNASSLNDGAATLLLATETAVKNYNLSPLARICDYTSYANKPEEFTEAPIPCIQKLLTRQKLSAKDIHLWEINEAFAVVSLAAQKQLKLSSENLNIRGGAVALGHPIGCSGARLVVTLVHALKQTKQKLGIAALCIGGGEASAMLVENLVGKLVET